MEDILRRANGNKLYIVTVNRNSIVSLLKKICKEVFYMGTYSYYHCYDCGYHSSNYNNGKCPRCGSTNYHAEAENEQE